MSSRKKKIASALALGATVTGAVSSGVTSAGLFDWFKNKENLNKKRIEKQEKGYNAAIQLTKNIYAIEKNKKLEKSKSVPQIIHNLILDREEHFLKNLGVNIDEFNNLQIKDTAVMEKLEKYFLKKICKLQKVYDDIIINKENFNNLVKTEDLGDNNLTTTKSAIYKFEKKDGKIYYVRIPGDDKQRIFILRKLYDNFIDKKLIIETNKEDEQNIAEALIDLAKEDTLEQYNIKNPKKPLLNLSYEEIIKTLIYNKMTKLGFLGYNLTYIDDFCKIFEENNDKKKDSQKADLTTILHGLGYEKNMNILPSYDKDKGLLLGRVGRLGVNAAVWTLGYLYPPTAVVGGIAGLLCNSVVKQSVQSLWDNLRHKETRTSFLNPNNWEVSKFLKNVVSSYTVYSIIKDIIF